MKKLFMTWDKTLVKHVQSVLGMVIIGPPKLLGLPADIWSVTTITEGKTDVNAAMKTAFIANRVRLGAINLLMVLSLPLYVLVFVMIPKPEAVMPNITLPPMIQQYLPEPAPTAESMYQKGRKGRANILEECTTNSRQLAIYGKAVMQKNIDACMAEAIPRLVAQQTEKHNLSPEFAAALERGMKGE